MFGFFFMVEVSSDITNKIIEIVKAGKGEVFEQDGYVNFCGVRNNTTDDTFNDTLYIYWKEGGAFKCIKTAQFTTKPGKSAFFNENGKANSGGIAILKEMWHPDMWTIGNHQGKYSALKQTGKATITRDKSQYGKKSGGYVLNINESTTQTGTYGINMHKSGSPEGKNVNRWSEGCQVFKVQSDFNEMMNLVQQAVSKGQKSFSYFLTNMNVLAGNNIVDNSSTAYTPSGAGGGAVAGAVGGAGGSSLYSNNVSGLGGAYSGGGGPVTYKGFATYNSFGTDVIFGQVFPNDDNNRYIDMSSEDISIIQYSEPTLKVDEIEITEKSKATMGVDIDKISYYVPIVVVNDFMLPQTYITNFVLDYTSFAPQVMIEFVDMTNELLSTNVPKPGSYVKVFIGGNGDERYYKPVRQDFVITNVTKTNKTGGEYQNYPNSGNPIKYRLSGILNVPLGFRKMAWSSSKINARQAMFNMSNTVGLGFATNFATNSDTDVMRWMNLQNRSYYDFMKDIARHSCYSPYTFFTAFIDQYYVLNYVECRRLLSHGGDKKDLPQMIYNCIMPGLETKIGSKRGDQKLSYYVLTNSEEFKGWTNYIEEYYEINDGYSITSDGYSKVLTYSDTCGIPNLPSKNYRFILMPIDNIKRDESKNILSLPEKLTNDSYIPLNLRQTTNSDYSENKKMYDNPTISESRVELGEVDTSNNFPLYFYSFVQNDFQMNNLKKCGLSVRLQNYNPAITRFSRIWVDIYDTNKNSVNQIRKKSGVNSMPDSPIKEYYKTKNENIISYKEEIEKDTENQKYNRSLSGWYVVTDMKIVYNSVKDFKGVTYKKLQTVLTLNRVDFKPTFQSEYEMAKKAIEKYKGENLAENIMSGADMMQDTSMTDTNATGASASTSASTATSASTSTSTSTSTSASKNTTTTTTTTSTNTKK